MTHITITVTPPPPPEGQLAAERELDDFVMLQTASVLAEQLRQGGYTVTVEHDL